MGAPGAEACKGTPVAFESLTDLVHDEGAKPFDGFSSEGRFPASDALPMEDRLGAAGLVAHQPCDSLAVCR